MSDSRLREIERRWQADPSSLEPALLYLRELARSGQPVELTAFPASLFAQAAFRAMLHTFRLNMQLLFGSWNGFMEAFHPSHKWRHILEAAIPDINLELESDFRLALLYYVPAGVPLRAQSLSDALMAEQHTPNAEEFTIYAKTREPSLLAVCCTTYITEIYDELQETATDVVTPRYYSAYLRYEEISDHWQPSITRNEWRVLPQSGYIYGEEAPVEDPGLRFNHGNMIYRLYGGPEEERRNSQHALNQIVAAEEAADAYRESIAETIGQTFIDIYEDEEDLGYSVRLIDRFDEEVIISWDDDEVLALLNNGIFQEPINTDDQGPFHTSVYQYVEQLRGLPWQDTHNETGHMRNPLDW